MAKGSLPCLDHHSSGPSDSSDCQIKSCHFFRLKSRPRSATIGAVISLAPTTQTRHPGSFWGCRRPMLSSPLVPAWPILTLQFSAQSPAENTFLALPRPPRVLSSALCSPSLCVYTRHASQLTLPLCGIISLPSQATRFGGRDQVTLTIVGPLFLAQFPDKTGSQHIPVE